MAPKYFYHGILLWNYITLHGHFPIFHLYNYPFITQFTYNTVHFCGTQARHYKGTALYTVNSEILARIFLANSALSHICHIENLQLKPDLLKSVNNRVISPFHEDSIFTKFCIHEVSRKIEPSRKFSNLQ